MRERKTEDEYQIHQFFGKGNGGWEEVCCETNWSDAKQRIKEYRENMPEYPVKIIKKRVKKEKGEVS